jgi:hypothetical protein
MNDAQINHVFASLYEDLRESPLFSEAKPLLAHYTSIPVLEAILRNKEVWLSNPLYMNDHEEVRFGISEGVSAFVSSAKIEAACSTKPRHEILRERFQSWYQKFDREHVIDTFVFCLSEHERNDNDGVLSMWRGYGGNGNGAAIVFDAGNLVAREETPIIIDKVVYASTEMRRRWISRKIDHFAQLLQTASIPDDKLHIPAFAFFERIKLFALFTKHPGFQEEREWRVAYLPDRDGAHALTSMIDYWIGPRGIEPKLKFRIAPIPGLTQDDLSLSKLVERIILGPTVSNPLARISVAKMVERVSPELKDRIVGSMIPFRST